MNARHQRITELQGKPGQGIGNLVIPIQGKTSLQIQEDLLYIQTKLAYNIKSGKSIVIKNLGSETLPLRYIKGFSSAGILPACYTH